MSFFFPFAIMGTAFALHGVSPFGDRIIFTQDSFLQYYPFFSSFWHTLREGFTAPWSWIAGAGFDYVAFFAYYLASPLNLLTVLVPYAWLREAVTFLLLVKIGCAGLFTGLFLQYMFQKNKPQCGTIWLPVFSSFYALSAFTLGYYTHIIWLDSFALLPLVMLGLMALINEGKYLLYVISLALAVLANYLIGFYICIFVAIIFFSQCFILKYNHRDFMHKLGTLAVSSMLAVGMTAVLLVPSWSALQSTYIQEYAFPSESYVLHSFLDILGNFIAFLPPTVYRGLPNLYSGMITIMLAALFICSSKISRREKITFAGIVVFLLLCCNINVLEYMWNGFNHVRGMPSRYSFIISFLLVIMAYRALVFGETISRKGLLTIGISAALFLLAAAFGSQGKTAVIGSAVLCAVYLLLLFFHGKGSVKVQRFTTAGFLLVIVTELLIGSWIAIRTAGTTLDENPERYDHIQALLDLRQPAGVDFYRTDSIHIQTMNDPLLYHYNGISIYSSTSNAAIAQYMHGLGLMTREHSYIYFGMTPLLNAFLNMRYLICAETPPNDNGIYWEPIGESGTMILLENKYYLPLGFMVQEELAAYVGQYDNPFLSQNDFFSRATGLDRSLFTVTQVTETNPGRTHDRSGNNFLFWHYTMPYDGLLYIYAGSPEELQLGVFVNDTFVGSMLIHEMRFYISPAGYFSQGDRITFSVLEGGPVFIFASHFDSALFEQGYAQLASQPLTLTQFANTRVKGNVTALEDGLLYTSIPGDKNWSVYVNGEKNDIVLIDNAMAAVRLSEGTHEIEFRYFNRSFLAGIIVSLVSLTIFATLIVIERYKVTGIR